MAGDGLAEADAGQQGDGGARQPDAGDKRVEPGARRHHKDHCGREGARRRQDHRGARPQGQQRLAHGRERGHQAQRGSQPFGALRGQKRRAFRLQLHAGYYILDRYFYNIKLIVI